MMIFLETHIIPGQGKTEKGEDKIWHFFGLVVNEIYINVVSVSDSPEQFRGL